MLLTSPDPHFHYFPSLSSLTFTYLPSPPIFTLPWLLLSFNRLISHPVFILLSLLFLSPLLFPSTTSPQFLTFPFRKKDCAQRTPNRNYNNFYPRLGNPKNDKILFSNLSIRAANSTRTNSKSLDYTAEDRYLNHSGHSASRLRLM